MIALSTKKLILVLLLVTAVTVVVLTVYLVTQPSQQRLPSEAQNDCTAGVVIKFDNETEPVQTGNLIKVPVYAYLDHEPLGMAAVTINYDPAQLELEPNLVTLQGDGQFVSAKNYDHDPNLDLESSAIFALPNAKKLHVLASCGYQQEDDNKISCDPARNVWGKKVDEQQEILLAVLPLRVVGTGRIRLTPENGACGAETTQSAVLGALADLKLSADQLGSAEGISFCGMDINLDGSTDEDGNPTFSALDFREWLVYFKDYIVEGKFSAAADFNCDGKVNALDFSVFLKEFRRHL